ncbi:MAG TPA: UbiH/UbiF/VisC/COQ6 family ubiquinone biosynthesis hydroxylase [Rhizomicrobium sp.]|nr:UbiH/UbiF/VisC/COQ6 family ubiquinone biosynthesis hydroxylase [Rhizomicrobium sp.]
MKRVDVLISGGGMVGLPLGLALAQGGLKTVIVDAAPVGQVLDPAFDGRVSALAYASVRMLGALGVWGKLAPNAQPIREILVTDGQAGKPASPFSLHFDAQEVGAEALGHIAENRHIRAALFQAVEGCANLELLAPAAVKALEVEAGGAIALLADGEEIAASLVIAADGRESPLRAQMGVQIIGWSYPQTGIVATVEHDKPHNGVAYEHFLPSGPFAILPMTPASSSEAVGQYKANRSSLVWTEAKTKAPALLALDEAGFNEELARRFGAHLGATRSAGPRWSYPLSFHLARDFVKPRFALAGDCAHGIHPIAGQGLNLGLKDAAALAEVLLDSARLGRDIGALDTLKRYERWRRFDSFALAASTDALNRLFSNDIAPLRHLRDLGLGIVDSIGPARRFFMRHAGGDVGKLPRLMKGEAA